MSISRTPGMIEGVRAETSSSTLSFGKNATSSSMTRARCQPLTDLKSAALTAMWAPLTRSSSSFISRLTSLWKGPRNRLILPKTMPACSPLHSGGAGAPPLWGFFWGGQGRSPRVGLPGGLSRPKTAARRASIPARSNNRLTSVYRNPGSARGDSNTRPADS
jgi:hypothetical protein